MLTGEFHALSGLEGVSDELIRQKLEGTKVFICLFDSMGGGGKLIRFWRLQILEEQDAEKAKKTIADRSGAAPRAGIKRGESFTFKWSNEAQVNDLIKSVVAGL